MYCRELSAAITSCQKLSALFFSRSYVARNLNSKKFTRTKASKRVAATPSAQDRLKMMDDTIENNISEESEELFENESDFMNVHLSHREHEREMAKKKHMIRVTLLQKKYFKQNNQPSLLTWEERGQICQLHKMNPEKWNVHTLANSFPATEEVIEKILKSEWRPTSIERINSYNKMVEKNWKMLYEGKLEISDKTRAHLARFSSRKKIILPPVESNMVQTFENGLQTVSREFSNLVEPSGTKLLSDPEQKVKMSFTKSLCNAPEDETYVIEEDKMKKSQTVSTLDMYREKILKSHKTLDSVDKAMVDGLKSNILQNDLVKQVSPNDFINRKFDSQVVELESKSNAIQEKIDIPPYLRGRGSLYKLNDCYYDGDGELLYRVPGMG